MTHFAAEYPRHKPAAKWILPPWYGVALLLIVLNTAGRLVERVEVVPGSGGAVDIEFAPLMTISWIYLTLSFLLMAAFLIHSYRSTGSSIEKRLLRYPLIGDGLLLGGIVLNVSPALRGYPVDILTNSCFSLVVAYAISRHQFLNMRIIFRRNLAHLILVLILSGLFFSVLQLVERYSSEVADIYLWLMMIPIGAVVVVLYGLARGILQSWIDRLFFSKQYDYRKTLLEFSQTMASSLDLEALVADLLRMLCGSLSCTRASLFLRSVEKDGFEIKGTTGFADEESIKSGHILSTDPLLTWLQRQRRPLSIAEIEILAGPGTNQIRDSGLMKALDCRMVCPLMTRDNLVGLIILGAKELGEQYSDEDVLLISAVSNQAAVAVDNARLYAESRRAYAELRQTQDNLVRSERLHAMGQMVSGVAHDFNNALTAILGRAQLALELTSEQKLQKHLKIVEQTARDTAQMVRRLQDFARVRADSEYCIVDLNKVIGSAVEIIQPRLREKHETEHAAIEVELSLDKAVPVNGNEAELRGALINILINALEAMPAGGTLQIRTARQGASAIVSVSDTGLGMTDAVLKRLFEPFFTTKGQQGLGMGLSVAYGVVKRHGGEISVASRVNQGSTFSITLPLGSPGEKKRVNLEPSNVSGEGVTVLVVDDDERARSVLSDILTEARYTVDVAKSGEEGILLTQQKKYDIIVTDLGMPGISGREVAKAVKASSPDIPVVLVTGWGTQQELSESGIDGVIAKPFDRRTVLVLLSQLLRNSQSRNGSLESDISQKQDPEAADLS